MAKKFLVVLVIVIFAGMVIFSQEKKPENKPQEPLVLTLTLDKDNYAVGEYIQAEVKLENTGEKEVEMSEFIFEKRSVSFKIALDMGEGKPKKTFSYSISNPESYIAEKVPPHTIKLKPKKSLINIFMIPTIKAGKIDLTAEFNGVEKAVSSNTVTLDIKQPANTTKLVATIEFSGKSAGGREISGNIVIDLLPEEAPNTVANFVNLVKKGFYNDLLVHRVKKDFVIQMGCPYGIGFGGPGYSIESEASGNIAKHEIGTVSASHYEKDSSTGSQFFICLAKLPVLDGKYTIFGKVTDAESLEKLQALGKVEPDKTTDRPAEPITIKKVTITTK